MGSYKKTNISATSTNGKIYFDLSQYEDASAFYITVFDTIGGKKTPISQGYAEYDSESGLYLYVPGTSFSSDFSAYASENLSMKMEICEYTENSCQEYRDLSIDCTLTNSNIAGTCPVITDVSFNDGVITVTTAQDGDYTYEVTKSVFEPKYGNYWNYYGYDYKTQSENSIDVSDLVDVDEYYRKYLGDYCVLSVRAVDNKTGLASKAQAISVYWGGDKWCAGLPGSKGSSKKKDDTIAPVYHPEKMNPEVNVGDAKGGTIAFDKAAFTDDTGVTKYTLNISHNGENVKSVTASPSKNSSTVTFKVPKMTAGEYTYVINASDKAKNSTDSDILSLHVTDSTAPKNGKVKLESGYDDKTEGGCIDFTFSGFSDASGIDHYTISQNKKTVAIVDGAAGFYRYEIGQNAGKFDFIVTAVDGSGNAGKEIKTSITVKDIIPPKFDDLVIQSAVVGDAKGGSIVFNADAASDNSSTGISYKVEVYSDAEWNKVLEGEKAKTAASVNANIVGNNATATIKKISSGDYYYRITATDKSKNIGYSDWQELYVTDTTAPTGGKLTAKQCEDEIMLSVSNFKDAGGIDYYEYYLGSELIGTGSDSYVYSLNEGQAGKLEFSAYAVDTSGNRSAKASKATVKITDKTPPKFDNLVIQSAVVGDAKGGSIVFNADAASDNSSTGISYKVEVYSDAEWNKVLEGKKAKTAASVNANIVGNNATATIKKISSGDYYYRITATDKSKNVGYSDWQELYVTDSTAPTGGKLTAKQDGDTVILTASNFKDAGGIDYYEYYLGAELIGSGDSTYEYTLEGQTGELEFSAYAVDFSENRSAKAAKASVKITDTITPSKKTGSVYDIGGVNGKYMSDEESWNTENFIVSAMPYTSGVSQAVLKSWHQAVVESEDGYSLKFDKNLNGKLTVESGSNGEQDTRLWLEGSVGFGKGNDTIYVAKDANFSSYYDPYTTYDTEDMNIYFGDGNNTFELESASGKRQRADVKWYGNIYFGNGQDSVFVGKYGYFEANKLSFGDGIDTLTIGQNGVVYIPELDFGDNSSSCLMFCDGATMQLEFSDSDAVCQLWKGGKLVDEMSSNIMISTPNYNAGNYELRIYSSENQDVLAGTITFVIS